MELTMESHGVHHGVKPTPNHCLIWWNNPIKGQSSFSRQVTEFEIMKLKCLLQNLKVIKIDRKNVRQVSLQLLCLAWTQESEDSFRADVWLQRENGFAPSHKSSYTPLQCKSDMHLDWASSNVEYPPYALPLQCFFVNISHPTNHLHMFTSISIISSAVS